MYKLLFVVVLCHSAWYGNDGMDINYCYSLNRVLYYKQNKSNNGFSSPTNYLWRRVKQRAAWLKKNKMATSLLFSRAK